MLCFLCLVILQFATVNLVLPFFSRFPFCRFWHNSLKLSITGLFPTGTINWCCINCRTEIVFLHRLCQQPGQISCSPIQKHFSINLEGLFTAVLYYVCLILCASVCLHVIWLLTWLHNQLHSRNYESAKAIIHFKHLYLNFVLFTYMYVHYIYGTIAFPWPSGD